jgi:prolyl oligopeptidase
VTTLPSGGDIAFDASRIRYELEKYTSRDGASIPIQLVTRSDFKSPRFVYLYSYGAIGIATTPAWNRTLQMVLELGGAVAIANVRGGGERGVRWQAPFKLDRRRTLEDIAWASHWLQARYGCRVVCSGRSYGGLHTLASMVEFPKDFDLFVAEMPVSNTLEFLENGVFGRSAWDDFGFAHNGVGDLRRTDEAIETLRSWSPSRKSFEPITPVLLVTAETDERVEPAQAYAMAVSLARGDVDNQPVFLQVEQSDGHEALTTVGVLTFIARHFEIKTLDSMG